MKKTVILRITGWLFICALGFAACSKIDNGSTDGRGRVYPLVFEKDSVEIRQGISTRIDPVSCNGYNTLDVSSGDTSLLRANVIIIENGTSHASGRMELIGRRKGHTTLSVYDRIVKETVVLNVRITDFYLGMQLRSSNHPLFPEQRPGFLFLVDNDARDFYFFSAKEQQPDAILQRGSYAFTVADNTPYLTLTPGGGEPYRFSLLQNNADVYNILNHFFHFGRKSVAVAGTKGIDHTMYLNMQDADTGKEISFVINDRPMPAGVLE